MANLVGFHVEDYRSCGVAVETEGRFAAIIDFEARLVVARRRSGTAPRLTGDV